MGVSPSGTDLGSYVTLSPTKHEVTVVLDVVRFLDRGIVFLCSLSLGHERNVVFVPFRL